MNNLIRSFSKAIQNIFRPIHDLLFKKKKSIHLQKERLFSPYLLMEKETNLPFSLYFLSNIKVYANMISLNIKRMK